MASNTVWHVWHAHISCEFPWQCGNIAANCHIHVILLHYHDHHHSHIAGEGRCVALPQWPRPIALLHRSPVLYLLTTNALITVTLSCGCCKGTLHSQHVACRHSPSMLTLPVTHSLSSPIISIWSDMISVNTITGWREDWSSASVVRHTIVTNPTIWQPGFDLPRHAWFLMNHFRTGQGPCHANLHIWGLVQSPSCDWGQQQTMNNIVDTCQLTKFEGGLSG